MENFIQQRTKNKGERFIMPFSSKRGVINLSSKNTPLSVVPVNQDNVNLSFKSKEKYSIGLFYSETPQSKGFRAEPHITKDDRVKINHYEVAEEKAWFQDSLYTTQSFDNMYEFASFVQNEMSCHHYITTGTYLDYKKNTKTIVTKGSSVEERREVVAKGTEVIARKQNFIKAVGKPSIMCIDIDTFKGNHLTLEETLDMLFGALPELQDAPIAIFPSTGSNIYAPSSKNMIMVNSEGETLPQDDLGNYIIRENHGFHIFIGIASSWALPAAVERINKRMWLGDGGFIQISEDGKLLERCLIDTSVLKPVQPIYTYANIADARLKQNIGEPWIINPNAKPFSLNKIHKLTEDEEVRYNSLVEEQKELLQDAADAKRKKWAIRQATNSEAAQNALEKGSAAHKLVVKNLSEDYIKTAKERVLSGGQEIRITPIKRAGTNTLVTTDVKTDIHGSEYITRTVEQILENPDLYHGARCACIEDLYYAPGGKKRDTIDYTRSRIYIKHEPFPKIHDFAHGGTDYKLLRDKVIVDLVPGNLEGVIDNCLTVLKKRNSIFKQGNLPYALLTNEKDRLKLVQINKHNFKYILAQNFSFYSFESSQREEIWPKDSFLVPILEEFCVRNYGETKGVSTIPYLDISGHVRVKKGYDPSTGFIYDEQHAPFRKLEGRKVSLKEMKRALKVVEAPIKLFKFKDNISSANMLGAMFTTVLKQWFNNDSTEMYPGFTTDAPGNGIGKTKLLQILGVLVKGYLPPVSTLEGQAEEIKKEIGAKFASGQDFFLFDNVDKKLDSATMASLMTSKTVVFRILGLSKENEFKNNSFITASGKNMKMTAELLRRFLNIRIEPVEVNYLTHDFGFDPVDYTLQHRLEIVESLMILYMGYTQALETEEFKDFSVEKLGSYEAWSKNIGGCVKFIGEWVADPSGEIEDEDGKMVTIYKYGLPGGDVNKVFKEELEKDMGKYYSFMKAFCKEYEALLKNGNKVIFRWSDIAKTIETGEKEQSDNGVLSFLSFNNCKSGRAFGTLVKDFVGLVYEFTMEDDKKIVIRFTSNNNKKKIYYLEIEN